MSEKRIPEPEFEVRVGGALRETCKAHPRFEPTFRGRLATLLVERWGMVAGDSHHRLPGMRHNEGAPAEDSQGRARLLLMTPEQVVERACTTADMLVTEIERRGWFEVLPSLEELRSGDKSPDERAPR